MGIQDRCETFLPVIFASPNSGEDAGYLSKNAKFVDRADICDDVAIRVLVFEEDGWPRFIISFMAAKTPGFRMTTAL